MQAAILRSWRGVFALAALATSCLAATQDIFLDPVAQLTLRNGRQLTAVTFKTYDPAGDYVTIISQRSILKLPLAQFPDPIQQQIRALAVPEPPPATDTPAPADSPHPAATATPPSDTKATPQVVVAPQISNHVTIVTPAPTRPTTKTDSPRDLVTGRLKEYIESEYHEGSNRGLISHVRIQLGRLESMAGWPGEYNFTAIAGMVIKYGGGDNVSYRRPNKTITGRVKIGENGVEITEIRVE